MEVLLCKLEFSGSDSLNLVSFGQTNSFFYMRRGKKRLSFKWGGERNVFLLHGEGKETSFF